MSPKYRGGSNAWLDDEGAKHGQKKNKKKARAQADEARIKLEETNATVAEVFPGFARARLDEGGARLCTYRRAKIWTEYEDGFRDRAPVAVGDRVKVEYSDSENGVIEGIAARSRFLARPAPDQGDKMIHVLAANVEILAIVASHSSPEFSPGIIDRFLIAAQKAEIEAWIVVTKSDLATDASRAGAALYESLGFRVFQLCAKSGEGVEALRAEIGPKLAVFCGHSGVGKTSLLEVLLGRSVGKIGETSDKTGKGKHTTSSAVLIESHDGASWIDTPGVKEFGLWGIAAEDLDQYYPEFKDHDLAGEEIKSLPRYETYLRIREALLEDQA